MKEIKLGRVAEISSGLVLKRFSKTKKSSDAPSKENLDKNKQNYYQLTIKSVANNKIDLSHLELLKIDRNIDDKYLLKKGDVVMKLTQPYSAAVINFECKNLVASHNFAVIRTNEEINPEYLSFVLNGKNTKNQLLRLVEGTTLPVIKIKYLKGLKIRQRSLKEQKKYALLSSLLENRLKLKNRHLEIEKQITDDFLASM